MSSSDDPHDPLALLRESAGRSRPDAVPWYRWVSASSLLPVDRSNLARLLGYGVAVAVAAVAIWWALRPPSVPVEARLPVAAPSVAISSGAPPTTAASQPVAMFVHVAGAVRRPGLVVLDADARVVDAIELAGGLGASADLNRVNLAARVADGDRLYVPHVDDETVPVVVGPTAEAGRGSAVSVNLNTATVEQLDALPGVGPATAAAIVSHREGRGPYVSVVDLLDVPGIGDAKLETLRDLVTV